MVERLKKGDNAWVNLGPEKLWSLALVRSVSLQRKEITASLYIPSTSSSSTAIKVAKDNDQSAVVKRTSGKGDNDNDNSNDDDLDMVSKFNGKDEELFDRYFELSTEEITFKDADVLGFDAGHLRDWQNVLDMGDLNEAALMHLLYQRFMKKKSIYTFIGDVLISINPYSEVGSFDVTIPSQEEIDSMEERGDLEPHLYLIADRAFRHMLTEGPKGTSQSILINGESGSGKTEAAKYIMKCLAQRSLGSKQKKKAESSVQINKYLGKMGVPGGAASAAAKKPLGGNPAFAGRGRGRGGGLAAFQAVTSRAETPPSKSGDGLDDAGARVEKCFLQSNPLLEAFGNAKTIRNYNSSRFGKFVQVEYDQEGCILGAKTKHFFLEKTRLVSHRKGERNFHIFYQFYAAAKAGVIPDIENIINLQNLSDYDFLCPVSMTKDLAAVGHIIREEVDDDDFKIEGVDDLQSFNETMNAMDIVGINDDEKMHVWRVLSVILLLGNIKFYDPNSSENSTNAAASSSSATTSTSFNSPFKGSSSSRHNMSSSAIVKDDEQQVFNKAADLLAINKGFLESALCFRTVRAGTRGSISLVPLSVTQAAESRDGLAKAIYDALFDWLVHRVNTSTIDILGSSASSTKKHPLFIGILDIFGFEVLPINMFEQLCINYANEVMQRIFDHHVFDLEQQLYEREGIDWSQIHFRDNQKIIDLLNKKPSGIFLVLDEQCLLGSQATDAAYLTRINAVNGGGKNEYYNDRPKLQSVNEFEIRHFAGPVLYNVSHIINKNMDALQTDLASLLSMDVPRMPVTHNAEETSESDQFTAKEDGEGEVNAGAQFIRDIFIRAWREDVIAKKTAPKVSARALKSSENDDSTASPSRKLATLETVSFRFRNQLNELNEHLLSTHQSFVRCVKSNDEKLPLTWVSPLVLLQLQYLSVMEMVRIRREGYPVRQNPRDIVSRFQSLLKQTKFEWIPGTNDRLACEELLRSALGNNSEKRLWQMGNTKCFLRDKVLETLSNLARKKYTDGAVEVQKMFRAYSQRQKYQKIKQASKTIIDTWRKTKGKKKFAREVETLMKIQATARMHQQKQKYKKMKTAAIEIQTFFRSAQAKSNFNELKKQKQILRIQSFIRMALARSDFLRKRNVIVKLQAYCRRAIIYPRFVALKQARDPWKSILLPNEAIVLSSLVEKSSVVHASSMASRISTGFVSKKKRQLILTTSPVPRILYLDVGSNLVKGEIPWDANEMGAIAITESDFIVFSNKPTDKDKRHWQFRDLTGPAITWILTIRKSISVFDLVSRRQPSIHETFQPSLISGPLLMKDLDTNSKREWAERYFQLQGNNLLWWDSPKDNFPSGGMNFLQDCKVVPAEHSKSASKAGLGDAGFHIFSPYREKPLKFRVRSKKDEDLWVHSFLRVIKMSHDEYEMEFNRLEKAERLKELANRLFKVKDFVGARIKYKEALSICGFNFTSMSRSPDSTNIPDSLLIACLNNRAACNLNLSNSDAAIEDLDAVLRIDPTNVIALKKRARIYETIGQLQLALDDVGALLLIAPDDRDITEMNARVLSRIEVKKMEVAKSKQEAQLRLSLGTSAGSVLPTLKEEEEEYDAISKKSSNKIEYKINNNKGNSSISSNGVKRQHGSASSSAPSSKLMNIDGETEVENDKSDDDDEDDEEDEDAPPQLPPMPDIMPPPPPPQDLPLETTKSTNIPVDIPPPPPPPVEDIPPPPPLTPEIKKPNVTSSLKTKQPQVPLFSPAEEEQNKVRRVAESSSTVSTTATTIAAATTAVSSSASSLSSSTTTASISTPTKRVTIVSDTASSSIQSPIKPASTSTAASSASKLSSSTTKIPTAEISTPVKTISTTSIPTSAAMTPPPAATVKRIEAANVMTPASTSSAPSTPNANESESAKKKKKSSHAIIEVVIASHSYTPEEANKDTDLQFKKGTVIEVIHKYKDGWWKGILDGKIGVFPSTYVKPYQPGSPATTTATTISTPTLKPSSSSSSSSTSSSQSKNT